MKLSNVLLPVAFTALASCGSKPKDPIVECQENLDWRLSGVLGSHIVGGAHAPAPNTCSDIKDSTQRGRCTQLVDGARKQLEDACALYFQQTEIQNPPEKK